MVGVFQTYAPFNKAKTQYALLFIAAEYAEDCQACSEAN